MRAFVRNGVVMRIEQNYDAGRIQDALGNSTTAHWNPRGCLKGMTMQRRIYGPYRAPVPDAAHRVEAVGGRRVSVLRRRSATATGSPRATDRSPLSVRVDEVYRYMAGAIAATAEHYSGEKGARRLLDDGYVPEMVEALDGAGTRTIKMRAAWGSSGSSASTGCTGSTTCSPCSTAASATSHPRRPTAAATGRTTPGTATRRRGCPSHGLQNADVDFNDLVNSRLHAGRQEPRREQDGRLALVPRTVMGRR